MRTMTSDCGNYQISKPSEFRTDKYWVHSVDSRTGLVCMYRGEFLSFDLAKEYCEHRSAVISHQRRGR